MDTKATTSAAKPALNYRRRGKKVPEVCYANRHLTVTLWGLYDLCKTLAHENGGILTYSDQSLAEMFESGTKSMICKQKKELVRRGWLELIQAKRYTGPDASQPNQYRVIQHAEWATYHSGQCISDRQVDSTTADIAVDAGRVPEDEGSGNTDAGCILTEPTRIPTDAGVVPEGCGGGAVGTHIIPLVIPSLIPSLIHPLAPVKHLSNTEYLPIGSEPRVPSGVDIDSEFQTGDSPQESANSKPALTQEHVGDSERASGLQGEPSCSAPADPIRAAATPLPDLTPELLWHWTPLWIMEGIPYSYLRTDWQPLTLSEAWAVFNEWKLLVANAGIGWNQDKSEYYDLATGNFLQGEDVRRRTDAVITQATVTEELCTQ